MDDQNLADASPGAVRQQRNRESLTAKVIQGGSLMLGRQAVSMGLSVIGFLVITRAIGPEGYGPYAAAFGIYQYLQNLGQAGVAVYLVRTADELDNRALHVATTLLLAASLLIAVVVECSMGLITAWIPLPGLAPLLSFLLIPLCFQMLALPASARLEREIDFRRIAVIEVAGQALYYIAALPLVYLGYGPWSLAIGWCLQQAAICIALHVAARHRPSLAWDPTLMRKILGYSAGLAASDWLWQLRTLVNPVIVGHFLTADAVGQVGLTIRLLEMLAFSKTVAWRLSIAALARVQDQPAKLVQATTDAMRLQILALGPVLLGFSCVAETLQTWVFGDRWQLVVQLYPYLAVSYLTNAQFNIHSSLLYVLHRNWAVARFHALHVILLGAVAWIAVGRWGIIGYGIAELAALLSYPVLHFSVRRAAGSPQYALSGFWWACLTLGLFWRQLGAWTLIVPLAGFLCPPSVRQLKLFLRAFSASVSRVA